MPMVVKSRIKYGPGIKAWRVVTGLDHHLLDDGSWCVVAPFDNSFSLDVGATLGAARRPIEIGGKRGRRQNNRRDGSSKGFHGLLRNALDQVENAIDGPRLQLKLGIGTLRPKY